MSASGTEGLPTSWNDDRDGTFFHITARLFSAAFTYGASVLLASYDDDDCDVSDPTPSAIADTATHHVNEGAHATGAPLN